jgi:hypothetical protein
MTEIEVWLISGCPGGAWVFFQAGGGRGTSSSALQRLENPSMKVVTEEVTSNR